MGGLRTVSSHLGCLLRFDEGLNLILYNIPKIEYEISSPDVQRNLVGLAFNTRAL